MEQKVEALNRKVKHIVIEEVSTKSTKELTDISVCRYSEFPARECTDSTGTLCGTHKIQENLQPIITNSNKDEIIKYHQWEIRCESYINREGTSKKVTRWMQVEKIKVQKILLRTFQNQWNHLLLTCFELIINTRYTPI